jgi:DNA (cytosine-5)-methyltransferase 1
MRHGSLFSGIGGFDLAAEWMGWENAFHCEWNEFGQKVLKHHFPKADSYEDICKTDFRKYAGSVQIISGGFPCQPFSQAGKRKGTDDERYLWHEMLRAIQEIKPKFVIAENVYGITNIDGGMVFEQVHSDLEAEGYEVQTFIIPACAKNAPHRRDRCWFVAYSNGSSKRHTNSGTSTEEEGDVWRREKSDVSQSLRSDGNAPDSKSRRSGELRNESQEERPRDSNELLGKQHRLSSEDGNAPDSKCWEREEQRQSPGMGRKRKQDERNDFGQFPTEYPICRGNDGLSERLDGITFPKWRNESIKAYGNAIVPQVAYELFKAIGEAENLSE